MLEDLWSNVREPPAAVSERSFRIGARLLARGKTKPALAHLHLAVAKGHPEAAYTLGTLCAQTQKDYTRALLYYLTAAQVGHATAMSDLGVMYAAGMVTNGRSRSDDNSTAIGYLRRAAQRGCDKAMFNLAVLLYQGGETTNASLWFERAARAGCGGLAAEWAKRLRPVPGSFFESFFLNI